MKTNEVTILTLFIISHVFSTRVYLDPKFWRAVDVERFSYDFGVNITDFNGYITKRNGTPVILGERFQQIFLSCEPNDHLAKANISWKHNSKALNVPPPYRIPWSKGSVLMVRPLWEGRNDGLYECIAYSKSRGMVKRGVIISVRAREDLPHGFPKVITHPQNIHSARSQVDFHCIVSGEPPLKIVWYKDRKPVLNDNNHISSMSMVNDNFSSNLMINNVSEKDKGFYQCVALNGYGQAVSKQANINFVNRRTRRSIEFEPPFIDVDDPRNMQRLQIGDCGLTNSPAGSYPGPSEITTVNCEETVENGTYLSISWTIGKKNKLVDSFQIIIEANDFQFLCFTGIPKGARNFKFTSKQGFREDTKYKLTVVTRPTEQALRSPMKEVPFDICDQKVEPTGQVATNTDAATNSDALVSKLVPSLAGICGVLVVGCLLAALYRQWKDRKPLLAVTTTEENDIYVSHCSVTKRDQDKILHLFSTLHSYGVRVNADLFNLTFMDNNGGPSQWIPQYVSQAKKILMVVTPAYVKVLNAPEKVSPKYINETHKVQSEFCQIRNRLYTGGLDNPPCKVIIILDQQVRRAELPAPLNCCPVYPYPRELRDDDVKRLLGVITEQEPIQFASKKQKEQNRV